jgi:predicted nucleic acid-binding protein
LKPFATGGTRRIEPVKTAIDSSILVAGLLPWHENYEGARRVLRTFLGKGEDPEEERPILPAHALLEAYSVMTRMPAPFRVPPAQAFDLLESLVRNKAAVVQLSSKDAWSLLERLPKNDVTGGSVYDAAIAEAALRGGAQQLFTLNVRHFQRVAPADLKILDAATWPEAPPG